MDKNTPIFWQKNEFEHVDCKYLSWTQCFKNGKDIPSPLQWHNIRSIISQYVERAGCLVKRLVIQTVTQCMVRCKLVCYCDTRLLIWLWIKQYWYWEEINCGLAFIGAMGNKLNPQCVKCFTANTLKHSWLSIRDILNDVKLYFAPMDSSPVVWLCAVSIVLSICLSLHMLNSNTVCDKHCIKLASRVSVEYVFQMCGCVYTPGQQFMGFF